MGKSMFREMRRIKQQLSTDECKRILTEGKRAVLSLVGDGDYPYGVPVNYFYDAYENAIYIHCAKEGHKIDAINRCSRVCFTTWKEIKKIEHGYEVESVIAFGKASFVSGMEALEKHLWDIGNKYHSDIEFTTDEVKRNLERVQIIKVDIEYMTGKHVNEF